MSTNHFLSFICLMLLSLSLSAQSDRNHQFSDQPAVNISHNDSVSILSLVNAYELFINGYPEDLESCFFSAEESNHFATNLLSIKYPGADSTLASEIMHRNQDVRQNAEIHKKNYSKARLTKIEFRKGFTEELNGFLIGITLGTAENWKETLYLLITDFEGHFKILSLKDEQ